MAYPQITLISDISGLNVHPMEAADFWRGIRCYYFIILLLFHLSKNQFTEYSLVSYCLLVLFASSFPTKMYRKMEIIYKTFSLGPVWKTMHYHFALIYNILHL